MSPSTHQDSPKQEEAVEALKKSFKQNAVRCREDAAGKHPGVGNICTAEAVTWEAALALLDALGPQEQGEPEETGRVPRGGEIREVMTQRGLVEMIPVSALLSDEVVEAVAAAGYSPDDSLDWGDCPVKEIHRAEARVALQAAIATLTGGERA